MTTVNVACPIEGCDDKISVDLLMTVGDKTKDGKHVPVSLKLVNVAERAGEHITAKHPELVDHA